VASALDDAGRDRQRDDGAQSGRQRGYRTAIAGAQAAGTKPLIRWSPIAVPGSRVSEGVVEHGDRDRAERHARNQPLPAPGSPRRRRRRGRR
jgi:hypothetical protein